MSYIRHDENNTPESPQPGKNIVNQFSGTEGWSTVTYENFNADYVARTYNSPAGTGTRTQSTYQRHDKDNNPVSVGTYQRHDENNNPISA